MKLRTGRVGAKNEAEYDAEWEQRIEPNMMLSMKRKNARNSGKADLQANQKQECVQISLSIFRVTEMLISAYVVLVARQKSTAINPSYIADFCPPSFQF